MLTRLPRLGALGLLLSVAVLGSTTVTVRADTRTLPDGRDADRLDIAWARHGHPRSAQGQNVVHTIRTRDAWSPEILDRGGEIRITFDILGRRRSRRFVTVRHSKDCGIYATLHARGEVVAKLSARRPDRRTVRVAVPLSLLGKRIERYRWYAVTADFRGRARDCVPAYVCEDWVPQGPRPGAEWIVHEL